MNSTTMNNMNSAMNISINSLNAIGANMSFRQLLRAYLLAAKYELVNMVRAPAFALPMLILPPALYLLFGVVMTGGSEELAKNPGIADYLYSGWCAMAVMGPAIFGVGCGLAMDKDTGVLQFKRAMPTPPGSIIVAKLLMSVGFGVLAVTEIAILAILFGNLTINASQMIIHALVMAIGAIPFCAIGLFIGAYSSGSASPAWANLIYLPGMWLGGLFFPLPEFLQAWAVIWPVFHLNQAALGFGGVEQFSFIPPQMAVAVLIAVTVIFGGLALRKLARPE